MSEPLYGFRRPLDVRLLPDGKWELREELRYLCRLTQKAYTVPAGFVTDFASVPRLPLTYLLAGNTAHLAAVIHDFLYETAEEPKKVADRVFAEIMDETGVPDWRRKLMFLGVAIGGGDYELGEDAVVKKPGFALPDQPIIGD
jgi:hypothetical protein